MNRKFLFSLFFIYSQQVFAQTQPTIIDIEEFIKAKVIDSTNLLLYTPVISKTILPWKRQHLTPSDSSQTNPFSIYKKRETVFLDSVLSLEDRNHISAQVDSIKTKTWAIKDIIYPTAKDSAINVTYLSIPLFSINKEYAIIRQLERCGQDCGSTYTILYRKVNGRWVYYRYIFGGVF